MRPLSVVAALLLVVLTLGSGASLADPGNGKGNANGHANANANVNANGQVAATTTAPGVTAPPGAAAVQAPAAVVDKAPASAAPKKEVAPSTSTEPAATAKKSAPAAKSAPAKKAVSKPAAKKPAGSQAASHATSGTAGTSGDVSSPQPKSRADQNAGGANGDCGNYCSTRHGAPSLNGNGGGKATGKPCAGCVGKADNKNPPGQFPDGSDHNNGYECDGNHGIGKTNPAHTGCTPKPPVCVPKQGEDKDCKPVPPVCVPKQGEDKDCKPVPPVCVPKQGEDKDCKPVVTECVPTTGNPCVTSNRPPAVLGSQGTSKPPAVVKGTQARTPAAVTPAVLTPIAETPAAVKPAAGGLPSTGVGLGLELLGLGGVVLLAAGAATVGLRRRVVRG